MQGILDQPGAYNSGSLGVMSQPGAFRSGSLGQAGAYQSGVLGQAGAYQSGVLGSMLTAYNSGSLGCGCKSTSGLGSISRLMPMRGLGALPISLDMFVGAALVFGGLYLLDKKGIG
jgi:hypothetical protein